MKFYSGILVFLALVMGVACGQKSGETHDGHQHNGDIENSGNQALYEEVMKVHDEVMPKMDALYKAKVSLQTQLKGNPNMPENQKKEINAKIARLDSASEGMMVWMRQFNPLPDSVGKEEATQYLKNEMVRVTKVKEDILSALEDADSNK